LREATSSSHVSRSYSSEPERHTASIIPVTGTNTNNPDSDTDGAGDWHEVAIMDVSPNGTQSIMVDQSNIGPLDTDTITHTIPQNTGGKFTRLRVMVMP
jgi:hypothetical protein